MTTVLFAAGLLVAIAAAVRSTWSPCGLSMLSTITPVSEGAKGHRYRSTATWFTIGATVGGLTLGAAAALAAGAVRAFDPPAVLLGLLGAGAALLAAWSDLGVGGVRLPIHRRQVNERWLDRYRPWVYGAGFGWQIGVGLATYITTAAVYLAAVLAALTGSPIGALVIGISFGLIRGLAVFLTRSISSTADLLAFHRRLDAAAPRARFAAVAAELAAVAMLLTGVWPAAGAVALAGVAAAAVVGWSRRRGTRTAGIAAHRAPAGPA